VLGGLEFRLSGRPVPLGHVRQKAVLAVLLVEANRVVSADSLVNRVWGDHAPARARSILRTYLSHLRHALAPTRVTIVWQGGGYLLTIDTDVVDVHRFRRLLDQARGRQDSRHALALVKEALALWRGDPLAELDTPWAQTVRERLHHERAAAEADRIDWTLRCGGHQELLPELTARAAEHPLDERVAAQLMLALYRSGRQADALQHYQHARHQLAEELGTDPTPALRDLHQRILTADPTLGPTITSHPPDVVEACDAATMTTAARVPRQLPRDLPVFVGRDRELAGLAAQLAAGTASSGPVVVLHGAPGAGKSALAVRAAHLSASRFPEGQLHVNLRGATPGVQPLSAAEALHQLLHALGVAGTDIPGGVDEAAALLRTVVAGRLLLIVLDNAATAVQVRPLLPGCAVLVTSRTRLEALEGATYVHVGPLGSTTAQAMLAGLIKDGRPGTEPDAIRTLAELCDHLPLGLHLAAARLNARSSWAVRDLVDRLADERERLTELAAGDLALRSSLAVSHTALHNSDDPTDQKAAHALCLLGLLPITDVDIDMASAVLATSRADADRTIERLLNAHLVEETAPGQFHMHDLTKLFAHELGTATISQEEQHTAIARLLDHFLATTCRANTLVYPHRAHYPAPETTAPPTPLATHEEALSWLDEQRQNMITVIRQAWLGPTEQVSLGVGLALALHWYFLSGANGLNDATSLQEEVVKAAERLDDRRAQAYAHGNLAAGMRHIGQLDRACAHSSTELAICREVGDRFGEQRALGNLGHTHLVQHRPNEAILYLQQQLELARDIDAPAGQAFALVNLGKAHHQLGNTADAVKLIEQGLAWYEKIGDQYRQCDAHEVLARIHIDLGHHDQAIALMTRGLDHARQIGYRFGEIWALTVLARAHRLSGNTTQARSFAEQALTTSENLHGTQARTDALTEYSQLSPAP
jgi:DNA-binding SARP family transcriptional activator/tetratricopeptide (TPR) repeat protein